MTCASLANKQTEESCISAYYFHKLKAVLIETKKQKKQASGVEILDCNEKKNFNCDV